MSLAAGGFLTVFLAIFLCAVLQLERYRAASLYLEDALAASNLASAVIDPEEYGISHRLRIAEPEEAFGRYRQAVKGNLNLDSRWTGSPGGLISGTVTIGCYIVYNVTETEVEVSRFDENGVLSQWTLPYGNVWAPNHMPVKATSIYSELIFDVEGLFGIKVKAHKGNLVDIVQ